MEMGIWGIMVIAMASIMERMVHRMVRKCNSVDSANSKTESTARASASDGEDKKKDLLFVSVTVLSAVRVYLIQKLISNISHEYMRKDEHHYCEKDLERCI